MVLKIATMDNKNKNSDMISEIYQHLPFDRENCWFAPPPPPKMYPKKQ